MYTHLEFTDFQEILSNTQHRKKLNGPKEVTIHQEKSSDYKINSTGTENVGLKSSARVYLKTMGNPAGREEEQVTNVQRLVSSLSAALHAEPHMEIT